MKKALVFDAGPLINLSLNGLLYSLEKLKAKTAIECILPKEVYYEVCERPSKIKQFELGALSINELVQKKVLTFPDSLGLDHTYIQKKTQDLTDKANHTIRAATNWISIVSPGEMSCFAVARMLSEKNIQSLIVIDERTARMLSEKPENLVSLMSQKLHVPLTLNSQNTSEFKGFSCIRSSELVYAAYKKGCVDIHDAKALEALLYATKFHGAAITWAEIEELKKA